MTKVITKEFDHLNLPANLIKNISIVHYDSRHMVYLRRPEQDRFKSDVENFIEQTESAGGSGRLAGVSFAGTLHIA